MSHWHEITFPISRFLFTYVKCQYSQDLFPGLRMGEETEGPVEVGGEEYTQLYGEQPDRTWVISQEGENF